MAQATEAPTFSFSNLSIENVAELPKMQRGNRQDKPNPFTPVMRASYTEFEAAKDKANAGNGRKLTVPADKCSELDSLLNRAATEVGCGRRIVWQTAGKGVRLELVTVGGTMVKNEETGKERLTGGKRQIQTKDGKIYRGEVTVLFAAKEKAERKSKELPAAQN